MMIRADHLRARLVTLALIALGVGLVGAPGAHAKPIKEILAARYGWEVNKNGSNGCVKAEEQEGKCQPGKQSGKIGGFEYPRIVAVNNDASSAQYGDVYVIDNTNRVQVYTASGEFVLTFGAGVNKTTGASLCTAAQMASGDECQPGATGTEPRYVDEVGGIAIDPGSGDVYLAESVRKPGYQGFGERIQEFSSEGTFIAEFGDEVNQTTKGNICSAAEEAGGVVCGGPTERPFEEANEPTTEHDGFSFSTVGAMLTIGGPENLLYVGEHGRVQELQSTGAFEREVPLRFISTLRDSFVNHIAVTADGHMFLTYRELVNGDLELYGTIYVFNAAGTLTGELRPTVRQEGNDVNFEALQADPAGRLAVTEVERPGTAPPVERRGALYAVAGSALELVSEFTQPSAGGQGGSAGQSVPSLAFAANDDMYVVTGGALGHELVAYEPVPIGELTARQPGTCAQSAGEEADVALSCSLEGAVNPYGVANTSIWFQWGYASTLGQRTGTQSVCGGSCGETPVAVSSEDIAGLIPNATLHFRLAGEDEFVSAPEHLTSQSVAVKLPSVAPRIVGAPTAAFVGSESAVFEGRINPENSSTEYFVEYGAAEALAGCPGGVRNEACPGVAATPPLTSASYQTIPTAFEAGGLRPSTGYSFRLNAVNAKGEAAMTETGGTLPEGHFTTAPPIVPQAATGPASAVTATEAVITGNVNPDGAPASYAFELGIHNASGAKFGVVASGSAGSAVGAAPETLALSGLQPGTTYGYRIKVESAYGTSYGAEATFTTQGLPAVLPIPTTLPQLPVPAVKFPASPGKGKPAKCGKRHVLRKGRCVKRRFKHRRAGRAHAKAKARKPHRGKRRH